ncbi:hypothetical protein [Rhodococcus sp. 4CII]|uniref:hypothetical protein n=1 Tax=Rhodococcus sp. 4CII TaxID=2834580 RepID=UPI001BB2F0F4|nr:hypothetical protein [Rhodococcus sp. 4CII]
MTGQAIAVGGDRIARWRAISTTPPPVRATITNSSPMTRHHTFAPWCPSGVEYRTLPQMMV